MLSRGKLWPMYYVINFEWNPRRTDKSKTEMFCGFFLELQDYKAGVMEF